jgi:hypothetical protein
MASIEAIAKELKKRNAAVKLARSVSDFACKAGADKETQDFLWNRYQSQMRIFHDLQDILEQVGAATLVLQRAAEWRSVGVYTAEVLETLKGSYLPSSERVFQLRHQELIDKASQEQEFATAELTRLLARGETYLSS